MTASYCDVRTCRRDDVLRPQSDHRRARFPPTSLMSSRARAPEAECGVMIRRPCTAARAVGALAARGSARPAAPRKDISPTPADGRASGESAGASTSTIGRVPCSPPRRPGMRPAAPRSCRVSAVSGHGSTACQSAPSAPKRARSTPTPKLGIGRRGHRRRRGTGSLCHSAAAVPMQPR